MPLRVTLAGLKFNDHACPLVSSQSLVSTSWGPISTVSTSWGPLSTSIVSTSRHVVPSTQTRCSPSCRGKLYPSPQVEESPSTVTPRLDMLALRILHCHDESIGARPDRPWASHSITRHFRRAPTHPRVAHAIWEHTITRRHLRRRSYSPSYTITPRDPHRRSKNRRRVSVY